MAEKPKKPQQPKPPRSDSKRFVWDEEQVQVIKKGGTPPGKDKK